MTLEYKKNIDLSEYTTFQLGGIAENFIEVSSTAQLIEVLKDNKSEPINLIGYGSNTLISDAGLPGLTICLRGGEISVDDGQIIADAGVWWDDVVQKSIEQNLWGLELMSQIPGSVGAAIYINITAYGQSIGDLVEWVDVWSSKTKSISRIDRSELVWGYKKSIFQDPEMSHLIILRASLKLNHESNSSLVYQKALDVANELDLNPDVLKDRREIIIEARNRAGSIWDPKRSDNSRNAGSFFRNPLVSSEVADQVMAFEEFGKTKAQISTMNQVHGGDSSRVSAAHVMLAAGFKRGQSWGNIKLGDKNLLKIEALPGATAQELYNTVLLIQKTVKEKLNIDLEPEAQILGDFN